MLQTSSYLNFESKECLQYNGLMVTSGQGYIFQQTLVNEKFTDTNTVTNVFSSLKKKKKRLCLLAALGGHIPDLFRKLRS